MIYVVFFALLLIIFIARLIFLSKKEKEKLKKEIKENFGKIKENKHSLEQLEEIKTFFYSKKDDKSLDDITINDLDFDELFKRVNMTYSFAGTEYLYYLLAKPLLEDTLLNKRISLQDYFEKNESLRSNILYRFATLGKIKKYSFTKSFDLFLGSEKIDCKIDILMDMLLVISMIIIPINQSYGVIFLVSVLLFNIFTYFLKKAKMEPCLYCMRYVVKLLDCTKDTIKEYDKFSEKNAYMDELTSTLKKDLKETKNIGKNSYLLLQGSNTVSGDLSEVFLDYVRMIFHIDIIRFSFMHKKIISKKHNIDNIFETIGIIDSNIALASFKASLIYASRPDIKNNKEEIEIKELYHPLLQSPVSNSFKESRPVLITGSNASGKSTFLKAGALNVIFSQTAGISFTKYYSGAFYRIYTSMAIKDNIFTQESYYVSEIKSLKRIIDADYKEPVICYVDEVLRGTNTIERIAAASVILENMAKRNIRCFCATHDTELSMLLANVYSNYYFSSELSENNITFDYKLKKGHSSTRNAIKLLALMGYRDDIIMRAEENAEFFVKTGKWKL
ncbi:MutS domain V [Acetitomaculum ruminis DSM 5522]|uniref:MutS domain V n=1 Tax=Acetitomaculum ruminis DSM 5522 TaxID=1120918 RepID=A0A1I0UZ79_9FIRM|nr:hypothetical protein [Acetitomaculum ruminis]SFA69160.1 MutS domain V [Acetitomaculum ruminis DSM 5522]